MFGKGQRLHSLLGVLAIAAAFGAIAAWAASKSVDLDGKTTNGAESSVALTILRTYPPKVENKITNKAVGDAYTFSYVSAGPGGFSGSLPAGTTAGVGKKWTWETGSSIVSYTGSTCANDICFTKTAGPDPVTSRGPFAVPGRSLSSTGVTLSNASLTSSLIQFFSPPQTNFSVTSSVDVVSSVQVGFTTTLRNPTNASVALDIPAWPAGCCNDVHQLNCDGTCVYYLTDPLNCGACGNICGAGTSCSEGVCVSQCPIGTTLCGGTCVDLLSDPNNCGGCGNVCGDNQICTSGACVTCLPPTQTACDNRCVNIHTDSQNCGGCGINCNFLCPSTGQGTCSQGESCNCTTGLSIHAPVTLVTEAPLCETQPIQQTLAPGGTYSECRTSAVLAKEVHNQISFCPSGGPAGLDGLCDDGNPPTVGTYNELIPDLTKPIPPVFLSGYAVSMLDASGDGIMQPGEKASVKISVVNAGNTPLTGVVGTLTSPAVDLTDDGVANPVGITITNGTQAYGSIAAGPAGSGDCSLPPSSVVPATNLAPYVVTLLANQTGDVARPFNIHFTGNSPTGPVTLDVPISLGIGSACTLADRSFDGLVGLSTPMARLAPEGEIVPFPSKPFAQGKSRPLKLRLLCGGINLTGSMIDAPQIVGLSEASLGALDISHINLNDDANSNDPFFRYSSATQWNYNMRTKELGAGIYTLTIEIAGRRFVTGFVLE
jgi:hypothetical protein